jgi:hypothetical protein
MRLGSRDIHDIHDIRETPLGWSSKSAGGTTLPGRAVDIPPPSPRASPILACNHVVVIAVLFADCSRNISSEMWFGDKMSSIQAFW